MKRWALTAVMMVALLLFVGVVAVEFAARFTYPKWGFAFQLAAPWSRDAYAQDPLWLSWWIIVLPVAAVLGTVFVRTSRIATGLLALGALFIVAAFALSVLPIRAYPDQKGSPGSGRCNALLGAGPYGNNDAICFDVRKARQLDTAATAGIGVLILVFGVALGIGSDPKVQTTKWMRTAA